MEISNLLLLYFDTIMNEFVINLRKDNKTDDDDKQFI